MPFLQRDGVSLLCYAKKWKIWEVYFMKRIITLALSAILILCGLSGCGDNNSGSDTAGDTGGGKLSVVATIFPQYDFVREIAGDNVDLTMLLSPGSESHSYEPTPQDIITIQECDVFIYVGGESDAWVEKILESMDTDNMKIIALMDCVDAVEEEIIEGMEGGGEETEAAEYDEHVWTSPKNAKLIVQNISDTLCEIDSENTELYKENTNAYLEALDELDTAFQTAVDKAERTTIVFGDRFPFRYLADDYGLTYYAAFPGCATETEASAATVAFLIDKVSDENIPVVFYIEFSNEKMADTICEGAGAKKLLLHSCHNVTVSDFESGVSYLDLMYQNVENLREALQ